MGSVVGGVVGAASSLLGGSSQSSADSAAAKQALTGYNYLTSGAGSDASNQYITTGTDANSQINALLGLGGDTQAAQAAYNNYLNSTGYTSQLQSGTDAINSSAAAKGLLSSGGTLKALDTYGQNLGANYFSNYLSSLENQQGVGQTQLNNVASTGTSGGTIAANYTSSAGTASSNALTSALGALTGSANASGLGTTLDNYFSF